MHRKNHVVVGGIVFTLAISVAAYAIHPPHEPALHLDPPADRPISTPSHEGSTFPGSAATAPRSRDGGDGYTIVRSYTMVVTKPPEKP